MNENEKPLSPALASLLAMAAAVQPPSSNAEMVPPGYHCLNCGRQSGEEHLSNCQKPRAFKKFSH